MTKVPNANRLWGVTLAATITKEKKQTYLILSTTHNLRTIRRDAEYPPRMRARQIRNQHPRLPIPHLDTQIVAPTNHKVVVEQHTPNQARVLPRHL